MAFRWNWMMLFHLATSMPFDSGCLLVVTCGQPDFFRLSSRQRNMGEMDACDVSNKGTRSSLPDDE